VLISFCLQRIPDFIGRHLIYKLLILFKPVLKFSLPHFFNQTFCIIRTHNITEIKVSILQCKILIFENDSGNFAVEITDTTFNVSHWFVLRVGFLNDPHRGGSSGQNSIVLFGDLTI
jgi:hypothetical protein